MHNMHLVNDMDIELVNFKSDKVLIQKVFSGNPDFLVNVHEFRRKYYDDLKKMDRIWSTVMQGLAHFSVEQNNPSKLSVKDIVCQFIDNNCSGDTYGCKKLLYAWFMVYTRHRIFIFGENNDNRWMRTVRGLYQWFKPERVFVKGFVWSKSERQIVTTLLGEVNPPGKTILSNITTEEIGAMTKLFQGVKDPKPEPKCKVTLYSCPPCDGGVYMLNVTRKIDMAHQLDSAYSDACLNIHGHSYKVIFTFACLSLNHDGMAADFKLVKEKVDDLIVCPHDHALVISGKNPKLEEYMEQDLKMVIYDGDNPTAENMARIFYHTLKEELEIPGVIISMVEVEETEGNSAMYFVSENNTWE